jgi:starch phosphorylase
LGDGHEHGREQDAAEDAADAEALYQLLEREVIPQFYARDENGIPGAWVKRMRESMAQLTPHFSADRAVREYTEQLYLPAAAAYRSRSADKGAAGRQLVDWRRGLERQWAGLGFGQARHETRGGQHRFEVQVLLRDLDPEAVRVELYADTAMGESPARLEMTRVGPSPDASGGYVYSAEVSAARPAEDYTARVIPRREGVAIPLEAMPILWQR